MSMYGVNNSIPKTLIKYLIKYFADTTSDSNLKEILYDILDTPVSPELLPPDENGNIVPNAENKVTFEVSGDGVLAGIDNGRPIDHQSYRDDNRKAFSGQLVGIVRSTKSAGTITVKVKADGMEDQTVQIKQRHHQMEQLKKSNQQR
mgnify:CR=1 FL=1